MLVGESSAEEVGEVTLGNGLLKGLESLFDVWDDTLKKSPFMLERLRKSNVSCLGINSGHL